MCRVITPESRIKKLEDHLTSCEKHQKRFQSSISQEKKSEIKKRFSSHLEQMNLLISEDYGESQAVNESIEDIRILMESYDIVTSLCTDRLWDAIENLRIAFQKNEE